MITTRRRRHRAATRVAWGWPRALSIAMLALAGLGACGTTSAPTRFHTLLPPASERTAAQPVDPGFLIELEPVGIPAQIDQPALVVRLGDGSLRVLDRERWAGPIGDEMREALSEHLVRTLGAVDVRGLRRGARPAHRVRVEVRRLEAEAGAQAHLEAGWTVEAAGGATRVCARRANARVGMGPDAIAQAYRDLVVDLGAAIAASVKAQRAGQADGACGNANTARAETRPAVSSANPATATTSAPAKMPHSTTTAV